MRRNLVRTVTGALVLISCGGAAEADPAAGGLEVDPAILARPIAERDIRHEGSIYVPAYTRLPVSGGRVDASLSITLSIRNTSPSQALAIRNIDLYGSRGERVRRYLSSPIAIRPFASFSVFLPVQTSDAGSQPMFQVDWGAGDVVPAPVVEAIMLGQIGGMSISFASRGVEIESKPVRETQ